MGGEGGPNFETSVSAVGLVPFLVVVRVVSCRGIGLSFCVAVKARPHTTEAYLIGTPLRDLLPDSGKGEIR